MEARMARMFRTSLENKSRLDKVIRATTTGDIMALSYRTARRWIPKTVVTPDYTNQLDLFSEAPILDTSETTAPVPARAIGESHGRPRPPQQLSFGALEPLPPLPARGTQGPEPAGASTGG